VNEAVAASATVDIMAPSVRAKLEQVLGASRGRMLRNPQPRALSSILSHFVNAGSFLQFATNEQRKRRNGVPCVTEQRFADLSVRRLC
jgi:hypothetical protein